MAKRKAEGGRQKKSQTDGRMKKMMRQLDKINGNTGKIDLC